MEVAMPSRRQSSAMLSSPRRPSSTMRIFSSAENCRRVARRISFTTCSAGCFPGFTGVQGGRVPPRLSPVDTVLALGFSKHKCGPAAHLCRNGSELGRKPIRPMRLPQDPELDLAVRCAWLSFIAGRTHEEIAERVGASRTRVTRLIQLAQRAGLVKIFVEGSSAVCAALEERVRSGFALDRCSIAPDLDESDLPLLALGSLGARVLASILVRDNL